MPITGIERALVAAVVAEPDDDAPRLIYADWLDENAGYLHCQRAEFIRIQIALARWVDKDTDRCSEYHALQCRSENMADRWYSWGQYWLYNEDWSWQPMSQPVWPRSPRNRYGVDDLQYSRGFIRSLTCGCRNWPLIADEVLTYHPIREVGLWREDSVTPWSISEQERQLVAARWPRIQFTTERPPGLNERRDARWRRRNERRATAIGHFSVNHQRD